jgi:hypothetical protein
MFVRLLFAGRALAATITIGSDVAASQEKQRECETLFVKTTKKFMNRI